MSHVDFKKWQCPPVKFKKSSCRPVDFNKVPCPLSLYFTTKRLREQYMVSSGHNRWILCPLVPEGIIKFSVMPAGMKFRFSHELLHQFSCLFFEMIRKIS